MIGNIGPGRSPGASEWRLLRGRKAFAATAGNGAQGTVAIADVTGQIETRVIPPYCSEDLVGAGTLDLGVTGQTTLISAYLFDQIADATTLDVGKWWVATAGGVGGGVFGNIPEISISANIILTVGTADISDGQLDFFIWWRPLSSDGNLVLATGMTAI